MIKCESLRINMYRITHTGKSVNFPVTTCMNFIVVCMIVVTQMSVQQQTQNSRWFNFKMCYKCRWEDFIICNWKNFLYALISERDEKYDTTRICVKIQ